MDKKVELGLANKKMTADLFCVVFKPIEGGVALLKNAQSDVLVQEEAARSQRKEVERVEQLAKEFVARVPELKFSPAEIQSFLLVNKQSPGMAVANVDRG